jgi:hypothetical protein
VSIFGNIVDGDDVSNAVKAHLIRWMPTYLARLERKWELDAGSLPPIRGWEKTNEVRKWPETQLPAGIVVCTGTSGTIEVSGDGMMSAPFAVQTIVICSANTEENAQRNAKGYVACFREAIAQHPSLTPSDEPAFAESATLLSEGYGPLPDQDEDRTLAAAGCVWSIRVPEVLNVRGGPKDPLEAPYGEEPWPTVQEIEVEATRP